MDPFAEQWLDEDAALLASRTRATELGLAAVSPGVGAALQFVAAAVGARSVVEVGTGVGVSTLWLLRGMDPGGVLTSIDIDSEHQRAARGALREAGVPASRVRLITGAASDVLPRLTDGAYDVVHLDANPAQYLELLGEVERLLRPGGALLVSGALRGGRVADPAARDADTVALRQVLSVVRDGGSYTPLLLSAGDGVLAAVRVRPTA